MDYEGIVHTEILQTTSTHSTLSQKEISDQNEQPKANTSTK